jgi:hypothetical protein
MAEDKPDLGILLLGVTGAFGVWSATNTSPVGTVQFGKTRPDIAYQGMNVGAALIGLMSLGIALHYGREGYPAAAATGLTGAALWLWYHHMIQTEIKNDGNAW